MIHRTRTLLCAAVLAIACSGCNYVLMAGYLIGGPPSVEPDFDAATGESLTDYEATAAVVCFAPVELQWDFDDVDKEIAEHLAHRLAFHKIAVRNPDRVHEWLDRNPDWDKPEEIGQAMDVTYVIYIDLSRFSLYEENASHLYRGRAEAVISVVKMDGDGHGEKIFSKDLTSKYPLAVPRSTSVESYAQFKKNYLDRLSEEIGRMFYEYYTQDDLDQVN
ncbi:hypothetical protein [Stratiformator vulcanicus]|uniref:Lipoprotein n=1 Tax=Stratiformator vulcanicus TaxID=2527980 RepID=A0A517QZF7_9PLAN|nr:hypothetical protein [Stratiformator vulcanicus]QDT36930.1 hypothetical protein Pan189_12940 [Stratiformator vulcanicus]